MSEEKLKILEIIEPYTDKTLSEGCLILKRSKSKAIQDYEIIKINHFADIEPIKNNINDKTGLFSKILGHYDITAVLKCIYKKLWSKNKETILNRNGLLIILGEEEDIFIPLKPLHLYTKEEDLKLLEILGTKNT